MLEYFGKFHIKDNNVDKINVHMSKNLKAHDSEVYFSTLIRNKKTINYDSISFHVLNR